MNEFIEKNERRDIDDTYNWDEWGRYSRYIHTKDNVESFGLIYKPGRGYKIIVTSRFNEQIKTETATIQAVMAMYDLAPKVYKIGKNKGYIYFEVEHLDGGQDISVGIKVMEKCAELGFIKMYAVDMGKPKNYLGGKFIDYHGFELNKEKFEKWIKSEVDKRTHWGHKNDNNEFYSYQSCAWEGKRDMNYRIKQIGLDQINFKGKRVLDLGCNLGIFLHYVSDHGGEGLGVDLKSLADIANIYKYYYHPFSNVEFAGKTLSEENIDQWGRFDIVFDFAMVHSIGRPKKLKDIADLVIYEGHNLESKDVTENELKQIFSKVQFKCHTNDRGVRPVFWCWR